MVLVLYLLVEKRDKRRDIPHHTAGASGPSPSHFNIDLGKTKYLFLFFEIKIKNKREVQLK
jgi:hypothetical protein